jgi:hypothetical protein
LGGQVKTFQPALNERMAEVTLSQAFRGQRRKTGQILETFNRFPVSNFRYGMNASVTRTIVLAGKQPNNDAVGSSLSAPKNVSYVTHG